MMELTMSMNYSTVASISFECFFLSSSSSSSSSFLFLFFLFVFSGCGPRRWKSTWHFSLLHWIAIDCCLCYYSSWDPCGILMGSFLETWLSWSEAIRNQGSGFVFIGIFWKVQQGYFGILSRICEGSRLFFGLVFGFLVEFIRQVWDSLGSLKLFEGSVKDPLKSWSEPEGSLTVSRICEGSWGWVEDFFGIFGWVSHGQFWDL